MLFIWYLWAVKYYWVPISLIVVMVWAVLCPPVKDFILLCETLPRLVLYSCSFTLFLRCQVLEYLVCYSFWGMLPLLGTDLALTLHPSLFCHFHLCPDLSFNLSIVFGSFWSASHFVPVSSLITKIKDLRGNPGLPLPACLLRSSPSVSVTALLKWVTIESRSATSCTSVARCANLPPIVA